MPPKWANCARAIASGSFVSRGDAGRTVAAMIASADEERPPLRLALGSTAYERIERALAERLDAIRAQRPVALATDALP